nr:hypothetical protein GCM10020063_019910 [Dactylosporangium thailandense]
MRIAELRDLFDALREVDTGGGLADVLLPRLRKLFRAEHATLWMPEAGRHAGLLLSSRRRLPGLLDVTPTPDRFRELAMQSHPAVTLAGLADLDLYEAFGAAGITDAIGVALRSGAAAIGTLEVAGRADHLPYFEAEDVDLLEVVAGHVSAIVENTRLIDRLRFDAFHDSLTLLPNRGRLIAAVEEALRERADHDVVAVIQFDIVELQRVNEDWGYRTGNQVISELSHRLRAKSPPGSLVSRIGGDDFVIVLRVEAAEVATELAGQLCVGVSGPLQAGAATLNIEVVAGVALGPQHGLEAAQLLRRADIATHAGKRTSPTVVLFHEGLEPRTVRLGLAADLRRALDAGELGVHFQPLLALQDRAVVGVEALVRWDHPHYGAVAPPDIVALAEHIGAADRLTEYLLATGLRQCQEWALAGHPCALWVNVSQRSLLDEAFPERVLSLLSRHGIGAYHLTLEIAEVDLAADMSRAVSVLRRLRERGVKLSVDDFGTGYSSMASLRHLPITEIKIDPSFVQGMGTDAGDLAIVRATVDMSRHLGLKVVAEGVESELALSMLEDIGCDAAQGYLLCRPLPAELMTQWLADQQKRLSGRG